MEAYGLEMGVFFLPYVLAFLVGFYGLAKDSLGAFTLAMALFVSGFVVS